ncbi:MAG: succinyldiaminopimelate transaminase [Planctomycetota bacterium]|nr:succinyldiaminopimelate transaminase [Planctomycetota bacterium]
MNENLRNLKPYPMVELARRKASVAARGIEVLDFGTGDPVEPTDPAIRAALAAAVPEISQYPSIAGLPELRAAFAAWFQRRFDVELDPEREILPTRGSKEAMFHLPLVLVDPSENKRTVVYPDPGYPVMSIGSMYAEADLHPVELTAENDYRMDPAALPREVLASARIVWLNYPHNPTGQDLPEALWQAWVEAQREHGFVLCSDECYTEIYTDARPRSVLEFAREGCLAFHSLSKRSGMTAYRSGMLAGDPEIIARYRACRAAMGQAQTEWVQKASIVAWRDERHVEERRAIFARKRAILSEGFARLGLEVYPTTSTFYLWVSVPAGETDESYAAKLLDAGIVVSPGSMFGAANAGFFRVALVPTPEQCEQALDRWAALE